MKHEMKTNILFGLVAIGLLVFSIVFIPWYRTTQNAWAEHDIKNQKKQASQDWEFCQRFINNTDVALKCLQTSPSAFYGNPNGINYQSVYNKTVYINNVVVTENIFGFILANDGLSSPFPLNVLYIILFLADCITIVTFGYWSFKWRDKK